jgi:hypothetical protein
LRGGGGIWSILMHCKYNVGYIRVVSAIVSQYRKHHNLKSVHFWYDWGMITDEGQESYHKIIPQ